MRRLGFSILVCQLAQYPDFVFALEPEYFLYIAAGTLAHVV